MEHGAPSAPKKRLTVSGKSARQKRLREGWAYDEIAHEERLTAARVWQIVSGVLQKRQVDDSMAHALLQLSRLGAAGNWRARRSREASSSRSGLCSGRSTGSTATRRTPASSTATTRKYAKNHKNYTPRLTRLAEAGYEKYGPRPEPEA